MSEMTPFATLTSLAEKSRELSLELPAKANTQTLWKGLGCTLLGNRFVVPMSEVVEIMRVPHVTRLPGVKPFVLGISNVRGKLMAVLDLAAFFESKTARPKGIRRVMAVEDEEHYVGFVVDESLGMQHFPSEAYEDIVQVDQIFQPFTKGGYQIAGTMWPVLSLTTLAAASDLGNLAAGSQ